MCFNMIGNGFQGMAKTEEMRAQGKEAAYREGQVRALAGDTRERGQIQASRRLLDGSQLKGQQKVAYAASGVRNDRGSPLDVIADSDYAAQSDANTLQLDAARNARAMALEARMNVERAKRNITASANGQFAAIFSGVGSDAQTGMAAYSMMG